MPMLPRSGSGAGGGRAARRARRISSRLSDTAPPIHFAEALRGKLRQLALATPPIPAVVDEGPRQFRHNPAHDFPEQSLSPRPRQTPAAHLGREALAERDQARAANLASPDEQLMVQVDL